MTRRTKHFIPMAALALLALAMAACDGGVTLERSSPGMATGDAFALGKAPERSIWHVDGGGVPPAHVELMEVATKKVDEHPAYDGYFPENGDSKIDGYENGIADGREIPEPSCPCFDYAEPARPRW